MSGRPVSGAELTASEPVAPNSAAPLPAGTVLRERYRVVDVVGQGGMGNIYRAEDLRLPGRMCAIKEVLVDTQLSATMREQSHQQFLQEASILAQLDHPNLPKVSDFFSDENRDYLVMDFVPGKDLKQLLEEGRANGRSLTQETVLGWSGQILDALAYLHRQTPPVVHRDIKPGNIRLTPDGRIKLVDFGLVKLLVPDDARTITVVQGRGTALYSPLEQYGGDSGHTDVRTDIYALGATLYHLLTGTAPPDAKARFLRPDALVPAHKSNARLSPHVSEAIAWAMEMHPDDRPQSVSEFEQALYGHARPTRRPSPVSLGAALRANWLAAFVALALFVLAVVLVLM